MIKKHAITDTLPLGRPLKGILKNNQCSTLPRQNCSCNYLAEVLPEPPEDPTILLRSMSRLSQSSRMSINQVQQMDNETEEEIVYYSSANISTCDAAEKLSQDEVLDTVESSV